MQQLRSAPIYFGKKITSKHETGICHCLALFSLRTVQTYNLSHMFNLGKKAHIYVQ